MARPRPPYLQKHTRASGEVVWYVRIGKGSRVAVKGKYGSPEFMASYQAGLSLLTDKPKDTRAVEPAKDTLAWLIARYRDSSAWASLKPATQRQRENFFRGMIEKSGGVEVSKIEGVDIAEAVDERKDRPFLAANFLKTLRALFGWAKSAKLIRNDPTIGIAAPRRSTKGFATWSDEDVAAFEARWPVGARERLALALLLYTGLRRGDAARLTKDHIQGGVIVLDTEKTDTRVYIPILPELERIIKATPSNGRAIIGRVDGGQMTKESFGNFFASACRAAGLKGRAAHGLRKAGATRAANAGATEAELEAIFGWTGGKMAAVYTREADRRRLAQKAIVKLATADCAPSPHMVDNNPTTSTNSKG